MFKNNVQRHHINPRFRAYGKARIDIAQRAKSQDDWFELWKEPSNAFPFNWGHHWKQTIEYKVDDFAAEVGFLIDILGLPVNAFDPDYAMFTSPGRDFYFSVVPTYEGESSTPPDAIRIQFMVEDIFDLIDELEQRGVVFEQQPQPCEEGSSLYIAFFRTPHGICIDLWGVQDFDEDQDFYASDDGDFEDLEPQSAVSPEEVQISRESDDVLSGDQEEGASIQTVAQLFPHLIGDGDQVENETVEDELDPDDWNDDTDESDGKDEEVDDTDDDEPQYVYDDEEDNSLWKIRYS